MEATGRQTTKYGIYLNGDPHESKELHRKVETTRFSDSLEEWL
jgi:hypothetical protein